MSRRRALHVFATFGAGGPQVRAAQLIARTQDRFDHAILAMDGDTSAAALLPPGCELLPAPPRRSLSRNVLAARRLLREREPDLLLTYNWGAIETALAARLCGVHAFVHHEDGFRSDEAERRLWRRNALRRVALRTAHAVIVPSAGLLAIARGEWGLGDRAVHLVNGVDLQRFAPAADDPAAAPGDPSPHPSTPGTPFTIGTVGGLRPEKDQATLLRALAAMTRPARLCLVGDGAMRGELEALARSLGIADRVEFAGAVTDPAPHYRRFDAFALSSRTEQMPLSLLEAMATALPVVATDVGDVARTLPTPARTIVPPGDPAALARALDALAADPERRTREGRANRAHCAQHYALATCLARFEAIYDEASPDEASP